MSAYVTSGPPTGICFRHNEFIPAGYTYDLEDFIAAFFSGSRVNESILVVIIEVVEKRFGTEESGIDFGLYIFWLEGRDFDEVNLIVPYFDWELRGQRLSSN